MTMNKPSLSFLVPYRWFNEDKEFLGENLYRMIKRDLGKNAEMSALDTVLAYRVVIAYQFNKPVDFSISKTQLQRLLKKCFPNAKCLSAEVQFIQNTKYPLPACDFQIFF